MKRLIASIIGIFLYSSIALASNPVSIITGNVEDAAGQPVAAGTKVCFQVTGLQSFGGSVFAGREQLKCYNTVAGGNLPANVTLPQGAFVNVTIGNNQPRQVQVPTQSPVDLWTIIAANSDPPSLVSQIASGNSVCTVVNPPVGSIGTATITCSTTGSFPLTANGDANGFKIINLGQPTTNGDALVFGDNATVNNLTVLGTFTATTGTLVLGGITNSQQTGNENIANFNVNGVINVMDQPGAFASMETQTVGTNGTTAITATGLGTTQFAANQWVAIYGAGPAPVITTPTVVGTESMHFIPTPAGGSNNTLWATTCSAVNAFAWCVAGSSKMCILSNLQLYEVGDAVVITGAAGGAGNLSTSITGIDTRGKVTLADAVSTTVNGASMTGGNCTTSRSYRARAVDAFGGMTAPTATQTLTTSANAENWDNFDLFAVDTEAGAIAYVFETCKGASCGSTHSNWKIYDVEVPTYSYADVADFTFPYTDYLLPYGATIGQPKVSPGVIYGHNFGLPFGNDFTYGSTLPDTAVNDILFTKLNTVTPTSAVLANAASQTGTFTMVHDIGPAINSAIVKACNSGNDYECSPIYLPAANATTNGGYSLVTPIVANFGQGFKLNTGLSNVAGDTTQQACTTGTRPACNNALNYRGPLGGIGLSITNEGRPQIVDLQLNALTTMGVGIDLDETASFTGVTTTNPILTNVSIGQAGVAFRLSNINTSNVEFGTFTNLYANIATAPNGSAQPGPGGTGMLINSINSLRHVCTSCQLWGQIGLNNVQGSIHFDGGQVGAGQGGGTLSSIYLADEPSFSHQRTEFLSWIWRSLIEGSSTENNAPTYDDNVFAALSPMPDGEVFTFSGAGTPRIIKNHFQTVFWNGNLNNVCTYPLPQRFLTMLQSSFSKLDSQDNWYDSLSYTTAFANLPGSFVNSIGDFGSYDGSDCAFTPFVTPTTTPAIGIISSGCPFTLSNVQGATQVGASTACSSVAIGGTVDFPHTTSGVDDYAELSVAYNGQVWCNYNVKIATDGSSGSVSSAPSDNPAEITQSCDDEQNNPGTFNCYYLTSGTKIECQNNTSMANPALIFTFNERPR